MSEELRQKQKEEAIKRMKALDVLEQPIKEFREEDKLNLSEGPGLLYWLNEEEQEMVKKFEEQNDAVVYHVIKSKSSIGLMYSLLYVSQHLEEWEMDSNDLGDNTALAYVVNMNMPDCSEFGTIGIKPMNGGVVRTW